MAVIRLTKEFSFEMSHALAGYDGACRQVHGHSYRLFVTVCGRPIDDPAHPKFGMVMDFGELKQIVRRIVIDRYDHAFVIRLTEENKAVVDAMRAHFGKVLVVNFQPTCENMLPRFAQVIEPELPGGVRLFSLKLHETASSYAEWYRSDNESLIP